jgi:hypothetical protein
MSLFPLTATYGNGRVKKVFEHSNVYVYGGFIDQILHSYGNSVAVYCSLSSYTTRKLHLNLTECNVVLL